MQKIKLFLITILLFTGLTSSDISAADGHSQPIGYDIPIMDFDAFAPWLSKKNDTIYVVNFWATWCAPCVRELPYFELLNENYKDRNVEVVLVSLDNPDHLESRVLPFLERLDINSKVILLDDPRSNRWIPLVSDEWTGAIPATVIYSRGFNAFYEREFNYAELEEIILPLLN
jgi:thiol-disulfide isomerase/thioredoxin